jgi:signal transduction histidine kinase
MDEMRTRQSRSSPATAPSPSAVPPSQNPLPSENLANLVTDHPSESSITNPDPRPAQNDAPSQATGIGDEQRSMPQDMETAIRFAQNAESTARTLDELRRQMEERLLYQETQQKIRSSNAGLGSLSQHVEAISSGGTSSKKIIRSIPSSPLAMPGAVLSAAYGDSSASNNTIKALGFVKSPDQHVPPTPSYPFPVIMPRSKSEKKLHPRASAASDVKPTAGDKAKTRASKAPGTIDMNSSRSSVLGNISLPPGAPTIADDPLYPSPNLYDVILKLNSDPGLDSWWTNVIEILHTHYGAERASLAVPGDTTDLENVPWGQKATFNADRTYEPADVISSGTRNTSDENVSQDDLPVPKKGTVDASRRKSAKFSSSKRPSLLSRHSFAGFGKDKTPGPREAERSLHHSRDKSVEEPKHRILSGEKSLGTSFEPATSGDASHGQEYDSLATSALPQPGSSLRSSSLAVFAIPRALETEADPLIKRTGIVKLFGRAKPAVLTREYAYDHATPSQLFDISAVQTPDDKVQTTPAMEPPRNAAENLNNEGPKTSILSTRSGRSKSISTLSPHVSFQTKEGPSHPPAPLELYEEYEQAPPSPWSQSPAPSPAPRAHPEQNPFFTSHAVDEQAFAKDPPPHDYSQDQPLAAIGVDRSKTVVHIPLLYATSSKQAASDTLRFPVAVVSFLSPIIPYPANLRQSLTYLIPHLTTSFSLAQQYSHLERQLAAGLDKLRFGNLLGLGGTFSDVSSELELVAGLSGHMISDDGPISAQASIYSPDEASNASRFSPSFSLAGTPGVETGPFGPQAGELSATPGLGLRHNGELVDSYFNWQQARGSGGQAASNKGRGSKAKQNLLLSMPTSPGPTRARMSGDDELVGKESGVIEPSSNLQEGRSAAASMPTRSSSRNTSSTSVVAHLHREISRPFSDTITQLMLNSVPLHLFLAKAQSGEVIWTNSKFDAYRRSQPQEQRVRDPWQNIHPSELGLISRQWSRALQTGSQFTERVRVKRFNDESAYRWFIFRANPLLSSTGEVLYWIGSFLDVHEQHVAELKAAQEREMFATDAKYRALANSIPQVVFEATESHGLISANEQWHLYTGQTIEEAMNFGFAKHVHRDDLEKCGVLSSEMAERVDSSGSVKSPASDEGVTASKVFSRGVTPALKKLVEEGVVAAQKDENGRVFYSTEIRLRSKGGDYRWHLVRLVKVETSSFGNGEASWYGTCTDINDRKLLERELNKAMQKLNKEMESKTKFFSNMSHEIRTPLNGILGTIPFILDTQLDNDQRRMLDTIQNSSTNLRELVDNILDVSRVEAGKMSMVNSWFHVRSLLEDVIDTISSRAIDKGLEIHYLMDVDVPSMVIGDRFRIRQVLINLMGNAVKFTAHGEIYTRCSIYYDPSVARKPTQLLLNFEVVDTGKGFSTADAQRLMQRFSQIGGNGSQQNAGSGLGLFLSKQLVEMHGGKLTPSSREGEGAKFSFYVKVDAPSYPAAQEPSLSRRPSEIPEEAATTTQDGLLPRVPPVSIGSSDSRILTLRDLSRAHDGSPLGAYSSSSDRSLRSMSNYLSGHSSSSSPIPTPDHVIDSPLKHDSSVQGSVMPMERPHREGLSNQATSTTDVTFMRPSVQSTPTLEKVLASGFLHPIIYSVLILCPLDNAREAIKQHIEQVIPHEIPSTVTSLPDLEDWNDLMQAGDSPTFSHLVLNLPGADDVLEVMQQIQESDGKSKPSLVIISDLYQKRQINSKIEELVSAGIRVETVPKPVKPSAFSMIFDPDSRRDLSKDRNQDMAREVNNNFKMMSKMVKEVIGNKGHRILLVEDDETNRMVWFQGISQS